MMRRRELLGAVAGGAAGMSLMAGAIEAFGQPSEGHQEHSAIMKACCDTCAECAKACNHAFHHCLVQASQGKANHAKMAQMAADCGAFCALSAEMISRHSSLMALSCHACADACRRCADECAAAASDAEMKACIESCERCEESCRNMLKTMGVDHPADNRRGRALPK
jgi:hypothetical protein